MDKSILEVVHESAKELHDAKVMDEVTMRQFDAMCMKTEKSSTQAQSKHNPKSAKKN